MKAKAFLLLVLATFVAGAAAAKDVVRTPAPEGVLSIIITESSLGNTGNAYSDFDRLDVAFQDLAKERKWPVKIAAERLAGGAPDYLTQLRISIQRVRQETPGEFVYRAWTTLWVDGEEHDFKVVTASYNFRMGEQMDDVLDKVFRAAAKATADKIEPLLFPNLETQKKK
jgi:hypothetical protein